MWKRCCGNVVVVGLGLGLAACGGAPAEPASPASPSEGPESAVEPDTSDEPSSEAPQAPTPPEAPAVAAEPYAKVLEILPGRDDPDDRRARIELFNPTGKPCRFKAYTLRWGDASKEMPLGNVEIPAGNSRQRFLIVHPSDGDVEALSAEDAQVELQFECGP